MPSPPSDDYYAMLGVHIDVSDDELRRAWRQVVLQWHPDRAGDGATAMFQQLSAAYAVLSDPVERAAYDRRRRAAAPTAAPPRPSAAPGPARTQPAREPAPAIMLQGISGNLNSLLACGAARYEDSGVITLVLGESDAAQGGMATISMRVDVWCSGCAARGQTTTGCARCGGTGTVEELFSAWLSVPPGVTPDEVLAPSVDLPGMVEPVRFRVERRAQR